VNNHFLTVRLTAAGLCLLLSLPAVSAAAGVRGTKSEKELNDRLFQFADDMAGNPMEKVKGLLKGYSTPQAIKDLQDAKGKLDGFANKLDQLGHGKYSEVAIDELRGAYEDLQGSPNVKGLPSLNLIDKLWTTIKFAHEMVQAADANPSTATLYDAPYRPDVGERRAYVDEMAGIAAKPLALHPDRSLEVLVTTPKGIGAGR